MPNIPSSNDNTKKCLDNYLLAQIGFIEAKEIIEKEYLFHENCKKRYHRCSEI